MSKNIVLGQFTHAKTKESFPFCDLFSRTFFCIHVPLLSFVSYPTGDNKVVGRFFENRGREEGVGFSYF